MALSIFHRATGVALAVGTLLLVCWLGAISAGPEAYDAFLGKATSPIGLAFLFGWTFALYFHLLTGIRHLLMDIGFLFDIRQADRVGILIIVGAVLLTTSTWVCFFLWR
jgi:succinate dehydrogenase / fumarate reductase cytochrome b subunit